MIIVCLLPNVPKISPYYMLRLRLTGCAMAIIRRTAPSPLDGLLQERLMISSLTVRKIAKLARLKLSEQEELLYTEQLGKIIEYFDELASLDTSEIEPMSHALSISNALRADEVEVSLSHEILLRNAPDIEDEFFKVPRIGE